MKRRSIFISIGLALAILTGCGSASDPKKSKTKLTGIAVDDLIINGKVKAYAASNRTNVLANGTTDDSGSYVLDVSYDGVVIVEVTCEVGTSWMYNPVTPEIKKIDCIDGLVLNSAATVTPEKKEIEVNISPITELVVRQMKEKGTITKQSLESAQNNIGQMFKIDPLGDNPADGEYAKIIAAIHNIADANQEKTILDVIAEISEDFKDGNAGSPASKEFAIAMSDIGVKNPLTQNQGSFTPDDYNSNLSDIEISKQFFNELRTQAMSVVDYKDSGTPGFLDNEAESIGETLEDVSIDINTASKVAADHITNILDLVDKQSDGDSLHPTDAKTITYTKISSQVWSYSVTVAGTQKHTGTVTLPSENLNDISLKTFTGTLNVQFDGTVPLELIDKRGTGSQTVKANISLNRKAYGADLLFTNFSVLSSGTSLALTDLKLSVYYTYDAEDELVVNHLIFDGVTLSGVADAYSIIGKLKIPEYVQNNSLSNNGFMVDQYETEISGNTFCLDEYNQRTDLSDGAAVYTDASNVQHEMEIMHWGGFYTTIDGNVEDLDPDEYGDRRDHSQPIDNNYSKYLGLNFDNISMQSDSCQKVVLENLYITVTDNNTHINGHIFCVENDNRREFENQYDENGTSISEVVASFGTHPFNFEGSFMYANFEGSSEVINLDSEYYAAGFIHTVEANNLEIVNSSCENPQLSYFDIDLDHDENYYNSGYIPKKVTFDGNVTNTTTKGAISGNISIDWVNAKTMELLDDSEDSPLINVSVVGKIKMPQRPEMILNLGFENSTEQNNLTFSYMYDATVINGTGSFDEDMSNGTVVITNHQGMRSTIKIVDGDVVYGEQSTVTRNGTKIGELQERNDIPVIKYTDGTFESLP